MSEPSDEAYGEAAEARVLARYLNLAIRVWSAEGEFLFMEPGEDDCVHLGLSRQQYVLLKHGLHSREAVLEKQAARGGGKRSRKDTARKDQKGRQCSPETQEKIPQCEPRFQGSGGEGGQRRLKRKQERRSIKKHMNDVELRLRREIRRPAWKTIEEMD